MSTVNLNSTGKFDLEMNKIKFTKATLKDKDAIFQWLDEPHMKEFWDNSPEHRDDILIFMDGRKKISSYWGGIFTYWIGSIHDKPYCLLLTAPYTADKLSPELWVKHMSKTGKTFTLDFCIGNTDFLNKGLAAPTLSAFTDFFQLNVDPMADTFFIDPDTINTRAKHVYEKAGFVIVGNFKMAEGYYEGHDSYFMVKKQPPRDHTQSPDIIG